MLLLRVLMAVGCSYHVSCQILNLRRPQPVLNISFSLGSCCRATVDPVVLTKCVNNSAAMHITDLDKSNGIIGSGPTLGVGIVTYATKNIWNYTAFAFAINEAYAEHNRYKFVISDPELANYDNYDSRWNKVKLLDRALDPETGWARNLDYVLWVDADLVFLDMGLRLEKVAADYPKAHIFASSEHAGSTTLINSGAVMVRNSLWTRIFLQDWWNFGNRRLFSDQEQFDMLYESRKKSEGKSFTERVAILAPDGLNSDPPAMTEQKLSAQVLHLMGEQMRFRVRVFKSGFEEICRHVEAIANSSFEVETQSIKTKDQLMHQLSLSRERLLLWTLEEYAAESQELLRFFRKGMHPMDVMRQLSNAVHHYAHGLENVELLFGASGSASDQLLPLEGQDINLEITNRKEEAIRLRYEVYELLKMNLEKQRIAAFGSANVDRASQLQSEPISIPRDWPEMVKIVATAGQHLIQLGPVDQRRQLANDLNGLLQEMIQSSHREQHPAIMHMVAHLRSGQGIIELESNNINGALTFFWESLNISERLSHDSGDHILVTPLTMTANVLATLGRYDDAFSMYRRAIELTERQLGRTHDSLAQLLVNFGMALYESGSQNAAKSNLERALSLMTCSEESVSKHVGTVTYTRALQFLEKIPRSSRPRERRKKKST